MTADAKRLLLMVLLAFWALAWGYSFAAFATTPPAGGTNRSSVFFGWQLAAALPAFAAWIIGRGWPAGSSVRYVSRVPLQLALGLAAVVAGLILWARFAG